MLLISTGRCKGTTLGHHFFLHSAEQLVLSRIEEELTKLIAHQPIGG